MSWSLLAADTPRVPLADGELLVAPSATNLVRNPRGEGAVPGTPGTPPTHWAVVGGSSGLSREILPSVAQDGVTFARIRYFGTTTGAVTLLPGVEPATQIVAAPGQTWTHSAIVALVVAAGATPAVKMVNRETRADGSTNNTPDSGAPDLALTATPAPYTRTTTMLADTGFAQPAYRIAHAGGTAYDYTLWIGLPQMEQGGAASSPILPPVGTPGASAVAGDVLSLRLADVLVPRSGACTLLLAGRLALAGPAGVPRMLAQIDDGSDANRLLVYCAAGTASLRMRAVLAGVAGPEVTLGPVVPGQLWRLVASLDGTGRMAASLDGAPPVAVAGGPAGGLLWALFGASRAGQQLAGTLRHVQIIPAPTPDAALAGLASAIA